MEFDFVQTPDERGRIVDQVRFSADVDRFFNLAWANPMWLLKFAKHPSVLAAFSNCENQDQIEKLIWEKQISAKKLDEQELLPLENRRKLAREYILVIEDGMSLAKYMVPKEVYYRKLDRWTERINKEKRADKREARKMVDELKRTAKMPVVA